MQSFVGVGTGNEHNECKVSLANLTRGRDEFETVNQRLSVTDLIFQNQFPSFEVAPIG